MDFKRATIEEVNCNNEIIYDQYPNKELEYKQSAFEDKTMDIEKAFNNKTH